MFIWISSAIETFVSIANPALVSGWNLHVFSVLGDRSAGHIDSFRFQSSGDLFIGQGMLGILFLDHFLDSALQNQKGRRATGNALDGFREEVSQLKNTLRGVGVFARYRAANRRRMYSDLFGHFLDHHRLQLIDAM